MLGQRIFPRSRHNIGVYYDVDIIHRNSCYIFPDFVSILWKGDSMATDKELVEQIRQGQRYAFPGAILQ